MKKVLGSCILLVILLSAGTTIYAYSNLTQNLYSWYEDAFQQKSEILGTVTGVQIADGLADFNQFVTESKKSFHTVLDILRDESIKNTQTDIEIQQAEMVKELNEIVADLQQDSFDDYINELNIEADITFEVEQMIEELLDE
ncbi:MULTISPECIES: hypothetical protein [Sporosarcina]|uniref:Uncharacterized protein n=1 Tax=Sporosarcina contaminans TaxID=633403 RepID=A0ABW3TZS5_9BACL